MRYFFLLMGMIIITNFPYAQLPELKTAKAATKPFTIGEIIELKSKLLNETRVLNIYLPDGYNKMDTTRYHIIYLLDGAADEDFIHVAGLIQFNSFPWIGQLPNTILVGIVSTDRRRDFTYPTTIKTEKGKYPTAGKSNNFIDFIETELQPFIDSTYRTNNDKTIIGQSLGGLLVTEILFKKPWVFNRYIIVSPSLWWDDGSLLKASTDELAKTTLPDMRVYIGVGKEGLTPSDSPHVMEVDANLLAERINAVRNKNLKVYFDYLPNEDHATIGHQSIFNAFRLLFNRKKE